MSENLDLKLEISQSLLIKHYETESTILGMEGELKNIHKAQLPSQLEKIDIDFKKIYCSILDEEYTTDDHLINIKMKNTELLRVYTFIDDVLFGNQEEANQKISNYNYLFCACPTGKKVIENGILHYYFKVGQVTIQQLSTRYTKFELLFMTAFLYLFTKEKFVLDNNCTKEGLAMNICYLLEEIPFDPRMILTMYGPRIIHNNVDANLHVFDTILEASNRAGIKTSGLEFPEIYRHYCISQVYPSIFKEIDIIQSPYKQIHLKPNEQQPILENGKKMGTFENYYFYGLGDGLSSYTPVLKQELPEFLKNKSHSVIRKAIYLLQNQKEDFKIIQELNKLLKSKDIKDIQEIPSDDVKVYLTILFNVGVQFLNNQRELVSFNPIDIQLRLNVEPTSPYWTDRLRMVISSLLDLIENVPKSLNKKPLVTIRRNKYKVIRNEHQFELQEFVPCLRKLLDLGLIDVLFGFGKDLIATANYYYLKYYSTTLTMVGFNIEDLPEN